eukprot:364757-Chlamydomonas_euryale.AAC.6
MEALSKQGRFLAQHGSMGRVMRVVGQRVRCDLWRTNGRRVRNGKTSNCIPAHGALDKNTAHKAPHQHPTESTPHKAPRTQRNAAHKTRHTKRLTRPPCPGGRDKAGASSGRTPSGRLGWLPQKAAGVAPRESAHCLGEVCVALQAYSLAGRSVHGLGRRPAGPLGWRGTSCCCGGHTHTHTHAHAHAPPNTHGHAHAPFPHTRTQALLVSSSWKRGHTQGCLGLAQGRWRLPVKCSWDTHPLPGKSAHYLWRVASD